MVVLIAVILYVKSAETFWCELTVTLHHGDQIYVVDLIGRQPPLVKLL